MSETRDASLGTATFKGTSKIADAALGLLCLTATFRLGKSDIQCPQKQGCATECDPRNEFCYECQGQCYPCEVLCQPFPSLNGECGQRCPEYAKTAVHEDRHSYLQKLYENTEIRPRRFPTRGAPSTTPAKLPLFEETNLQQQSTSETNETTWLAAGITLLLVLVTLTLILVLMSIKRHYNCFQGTQEKQQALQERVLPNRQATDTYHSDSYLVTNIRVSHC